MFIRNDGRRQPLQPPYEGPFKVLSEIDKFDSCPKQS